MDSDYLANNHNWGTYFGGAIDTQQIVRDNDMINFWYSTIMWGGSAGRKRNWYSRNRRCDWCSKILCNTILILYSINCQRHDRYPIALVISTWYSMNWIRDCYLIRNRQNWYTTNRRRQRRDQLLILNKLVRGASASADCIHFILKESLEMQSTSDTQLTAGDAIDIQYCLTEGKHLDNGRINLY